MKKICHLIWDYHNELLNPQESREFEEHLKTCSSCQAKLETLDSLRKSFSEVKNVSLTLPTPEEKARIIGKIEGKWEVGRRKKFTLWKLAYSISLAVICLVALILTTLTQPQAPALPPSPLTFQAGRESLPAPQKMTDQEGEKVSSEYNLLFSYQGGFYLKAPKEELSSLYESLGKDFVVEGTTRIYVYADQSFESALNSVKASDELKIYTPISSSYSLPQGNYLLILEEENPSAEKETSLFLRAWATEMRKNLSGWLLVPLFLTFLFLALYAWLKKRFLAYLFCFFLFIFMILPGFLTPQGSTYLYLGNPAERIFAVNALAEESTPQYHRIFVSPEQKDSVLRTGFFLAAEPAKIPNFLENLDWGQANALQIFYFSSQADTALLVLAIFLSKAVIYFLPLILFAMLLLGPGREREAIIH
ncbi:MAG: zf-HC2 domain-containing protein [Caldiserica bacterium]|jgi:hypothetical protein|nr:zf-HC2 domain-containing protein [Caldisericota bacterium]